MVKQEFQLGQRVKYTDNWVQPSRSGVGVVTRLQSTAAGVLIGVNVQDDTHGEDIYLSLHSDEVRDLKAEAPAVPEKPEGWRMYYDNSSARRKQQPVAEGFLDYMPAAVRLAAELSLLGNEKHNPGEPLHHARAKSKDHRNCAVRHLMDADSIDEETQLAEAVAAFWRAGIYLQELAEKKYGWPKAPRAK